MQIVIEIPEEKYDVIQSDLYNTFPAEMKEWGLEAIRNGTPLHFKRRCNGNDVSKLPSVHSIRPRGIG